MVFPASAGLRGPVQQNPLATVLRGHPLGEPTDWRDERRSISAAKQLLSRLGMYGAGVVLIIERDLEGRFRVQFAGGWRLHAYVAVLEDDILFVRKHVCVGVARERGMAS